MRRKDRKNNALRKALARMCREGNYFGTKRAPHARTVPDENARWRAVLDKYAVDGKLGVVKSGMDCDCTQYHSEFVMDAPRTVAELKRWDQQRQEWLDGPESVYFRRPQDVEPQHRSRDLALLAYEEGHTGTVYRVGYDQLLPS